MQFLRELLCFKDRCPIAIQVPVTDAVRSQQDSLRNSVRSQPSSVCKRDHTTRFCLCSSVSLNFLHSLPNLKCKSLWRIRSTVRSDTASSEKFNSSDLAMIFNDQRPCCRARSLRWTRPIPELWRGRLLPGWRAMPPPFAKRCWTPRIWPREYPVRGRRQLPAFCFKRTMFVWEGEGRSLFVWKKNQHFWTAACGFA